jgi:hypothetical protein
MPATRSKEAAEVGYCARRWPNAAVAAEPEAEEIKALAAAACYERRWKTVPATIRLAPPVVRNCRRGQQRALRGKVRRPAIAAS